MKVSVSMGRTISIGNYEFIRLDYSLELQVKEGETATQAWDRAQKAVESRLNVESKKIEDKFPKE